VVVSVSLSFVRAPAHPGVPGKRAVKWRVVFNVSVEFCCVLADDSLNVANYIL